MRRILFIAAFFLFAFNLHSYSFTFRSWNKVDFVKDATRNEIYFNLNAQNQPLLANVLFYKTPSEQRVDLEIYTFREEDKTFVLWKTFSSIDKKLGLGEYLINRIETDTDKRIWLLFGSRLFYENDKGELREYVPPQKYDTLTSDITYFFVDFEGGIWFKVSSAKYLSDGNMRVKINYIVDWYKLIPSDGVLKQLSHFYTPNIKEAQGFQTIGRIIQNPFTHEVYGVNEIGKFINGYLENALYKLGPNGEIIETYPLKRHTAKPELLNPHPAFISAVEFTSEGKKIIYTLKKNPSGGGIPGGISVYKAEEKDWYILEDDPNFNYLEMEKDYGSYYISARYFEGKLCIFNFWGWITTYDGKQVEVSKTTDVIQKNYASESPQILDVYTQDENVIWIRTGCWDIIRLEASASNIEDVNDPLVKIYPVPCKIGELVTIEFGNGSFAFNRLVDISGQEVKVQTFESKDKLFLKTDGLAKGVYFVELSYNKHVFPIKIVLK